jgi:hypothetical protein
MYYEIVGLVVAHFGVDQRRAAVQQPIAKARRSSKKTRRLTKHGKWS